MEIVELPKPLPDPASLSPQERMALLASGRAKAIAIEKGELADEAMPDEEARWYVDLLQEERSQSASSRSKKSSSAAPAATLDEL